MNKRKTEKTLSDAIGAVIPSDMFDKIEKRLDPEKERIVTMNEIRKTGRKPKLIAAALAACILIVLGAFGGVFYANNLAIDSVIDIDVNPGIEIKTNRKNTVREVNAVNADAEKVLDGMELKGTDIKVAVNAIVGSMVRNGYLTEGKNGILVTVSNSDGEKALELKNAVVCNINEALSENSVTASIIDQTVTDVSAAREFAANNGISVGKAIFVLKLAEKDPSFKAEELAKMNLRQLAQLISANNIDISDIVDIDEDDTLWENIEDGIEDLDGNGGNGYNKPENAIPLEKAKDIALTHANIRSEDALFTKTKLDGGKYEIEFVAGNIEYEYDIESQTGRIISFETENKATGQKTAVMPSVSSVITADKAKEIALTYAGVGFSAATSVTVELDDGVYEVEFVSAGTEYEVGIDSVSGSIVSFESEFSANGGDGKTSGVAVKTLEDAKRTALAHAKLSAENVKFTKARLDDGEYDIEFVTADATYKYEIIAATGSIDEFEKEPFRANGGGSANVSLSDVKTLALSHAGLTGKTVSFIKEEIEDDGFEIEFVYGGYEYEYEFSVVGDLISFDREPADN